MAPGIDSFRDKFKDYSDYYTIIGGTACDILLSEADLPFRATKDIDMILIMEDNFPEFAAIALPTLAFGFESKNLCVN